MRNILADKLLPDELAPAAHDEADGKIMARALISKCEVKLIKRFLPVVTGMLCTDKKSAHLLFLGNKMVDTRPILHHYYGQ